MIYKEYHSHSSPGRRGDANLAGKAIALSASENGFGLNGKVAVVTGAGSGIGRAVAGTLALHGARLVLLDRDERTVDEAGAEIRAQGGECRSLVCDVSDAAQVNEAGAHTLDAFGPAEILVNNAGMIRPGPISDTTPENWTSVLDVNLTGYFLCARTFGAAMRASGKGSIINIASIASTFPTPHTGAYSTSKAGVAMLSHQLAVEWGPDGVRSNAVCPGMILTELSRPMYSRPGVMESRSAAVPLRRIGTPAEVAEVVLFLASGRSAYVNGAEINVDGGFSRNLLGMIPRAGYDAEQEASA